MAPRYLLHLLSWSRLKSLLLRKRIILRLKSIFLLPHRSHNVKPRCSLQHPARPWRRQTLQLLEAAVNHKDGCYRHCDQK